MKPQYPEYDHSLLSLISSILTHYGVQTPHKTLPELDSLLAKSYKNIVVMLFDGMGTAILENHLPPDAFLRRHLNTTLSSVFPPTTTAATVSLESGLSPIEHAWRGWSLYFEELDANVNLFPNTLSGTDGKPAADFSIARKTLPYTSVFTKIDQAGLAKAYRILPILLFKVKAFLKSAIPFRSCAHRKAGSIFTLIGLSRIMTCMTTEPNIRKSPGYYPKSTRLRSGCADSFPIPLLSLLQTTGLWIPHGGFYPTIRS